MLELGATNIVSYKSVSLLDDILQAADGNVDVVIDMVGDALFTISLAALGTGGSFVIAGASSGPISELDFRTVYLKHLNIYGSTLGTKDEFSDLLKAVANDNVKPVIDKEFSLNQAQDYFKKSKQLGNVVLIPS